MEDKVRFLQESLELIGKTQFNAEQVYAFWRMNIDKIDASLIQIIPDTALQMLVANGQENRELIAIIFGAFGSLIQRFPLGNQRINLELAITGYQTCASLITRNEYPDTWAFYQNNLGIACWERIKGNRKGNLEQAIQAHRAALEVYTQEDFPVEWAETQNSLGIVYADRVEGKHRENLERAIQAFRNALEVYTQEDFPVEWARTQCNLGHAYLYRIKGDRKGNLERAIQACLASLEVYIREDFPVEWAETQNSLGAVYANRVEGKHRENLKQAIQAFRNTLEVYTQENFPVEWAKTQNNLGKAYRKWIEGDRKGNLERAIQAFRDVLEVCTREDFPVEWAETQYNLGAAYSERIEGDRKKNIKQSIQACLASLEVYTREDFPVEWARTQITLNIAYQDRTEGDRKGNLERAIQAFQDVLEVCTREDFPVEWARTQINLGNAYQDQTEGDRKENLELAIQACLASLEVYTQEDFPVEWARTQINLGNAYQDQTEGDRKENLELAIQARFASLEVYTREDFPIEWAKTQNNLGNTYGERIEGDRKGNIKLAIQAYRAALEVNQPELLPLDCLRTGSNLGNLAFKEGIWHIAIEGFEKAIAAVETSRSWAMSDHRRQEILDQSISIYEKMLQSCINANRLDKALQTVERVRSKRLVDLMAAPDLYPQGEIPEPVRLILDGIANVQQQMDDLRMVAPAAAGTRDRAAIAPPTEKIRDLEVEKQALLDKLSRSDTVSAQLLEISPPDVSQIQTELLDRPDVALLSFYTTTQDTHILIVRSDSIQCFTCQGQGFEQLQRWLINEWVLPYIKDRKRWEQNMPERLQQLAEKLELDRLIAKYLQNTRELILIPHLLLHLIPFAALPLNGNQQYFGDRFLLRYAPGCQVLKFCTDRNVLLGQPQYGTVENTTEDLPFSAIEGEAIARIFQIEVINRLRGSQQVTIDAYRQLLDRVNSVASCHHAQSRFDNPLESALILANGMRVTLADLLSPAWRFADLSDVFLSCCETGMTMPQSFTDELLTLGTGFLCAGARSVISSLWAVSDLATALLSQIYHQYRAQGQDRIVALQKAQQDLRRISGEQLEALSEAEFISVLEAQLEPLEQCRQTAYSQKQKATPDSEAYQQWESEEKRYSDLIDPLVAAIMNLEELWEKALPFDHPIYWAPFTCQGLR